MILDNLIEFHTRTHTISKGYFMDKNSSKLEIPQHVLALK